MMVPIMSHAENVSIHSVHSSLPFRKYSQNPFRAEHPSLFAASPPKQTFHHSKSLAALCGDQLNSGLLDPLGETISQKQLYQSILTPEIRLNFECMKEILPALPCELTSMKVDLPVSPKRKCLVLDLDETLIHTLRSLDKYYDVELPKVEKAVYKDSLGNEFSFHFVVRPFAENLLKTLSENYQIIVRFLD